MINTCCIFGEFGKYLYKGNGVFVSLPLNILFLEIGVKCADAPNHVFFSITVH